MVVMVVVIRKTCHGIVSVCYIPRSKVCIIQYLVYMAMYSARRHVKVRRKKVKEGILTMHYTSDLNRFGFPSRSLMKITTRRGMALKKRSFRATRRSAVCRRTGASYSLRRKKEWQR